MKKNHHKNGKEIQIKKKLFNEMIFKITFLKNIYIQFF